MLYRSGVNLNTGLQTFIDKSDSITLFSAYIKLDQLRKINKANTIKQIVVRWEIQDLLMKVSDLEIYDYCKENDIKLFRNTRIHLKAFWDNRQSVFFGSANVTNRGIGEGENNGAIANYNFELNGLHEKITTDDIIYFNRIISTSEYVTLELYDHIKQVINHTEIPTFKFPILETKKKTIDYFLISQLPMYPSIEDLFKFYMGDIFPNIEEVNCAAHDLVLYEVPDGLYYEDFKAHIRGKFNFHPFILKIKDFIREQPNQSINYGGIIRWIQNNTTTVPTPRSWDLKKDQIVNNLYEWICYNDSQFTWDVPGAKSQVIYYRPE